MKRANWREANLTPLLSMRSREFLVLRATHKKTCAFLIALLNLHVDGEEDLQLRDELAKVEGEDKRICRALFLMLVLFMLAVAGLAYCAILLPPVYRNSDDLLIRCLLVLGLGSLISQAGFLGFLVWHRVVVRTRLYEECQLRILALAQAKLERPAALNPMAPVDSPPPKAPPGASTQQLGMTSQELLCQEGFCSGL